MSLDRSDAFGYVHGRSWLHRLGPVPKLAWLASAVAVAIVAQEPGVLAAMALAGALLAGTAGVGGTAMRLALPLVPIGASVVVLQALAPAACQPACRPAAEIGPLAIHAEGLARSVTVVLRLLALQALAVAMLATTHPSDLFAGLRALRLPAQGALMGVMAVQLIPVMQRQVHLVLAAQRARGMRSSGLRALLPALVPVAAASFERVGQLVVALETRGMGAGRRTSYREVGFGARERLATLGAVVAGGAGVWAAFARWNRDPSVGLVLPGPLALVVFIAAVALFVVTMAIGLRRAAAALH